MEPKLGGRCHRARGLSLPPLAVGTEKHGDNDGGFYFPCARDGRGSPSLAPLVWELLCGTKGSLTFALHLQHPGRGLRRERKDNSE